MEHEKCYVFNQHRFGRKSSGNVDSNWTDKLFPTRKQSYHDLWQQQNERFDAIQRTEASEALDEILLFIQSPVEDHARIPAALVQTNADSGSQIGLFDQLKERVGGRSRYLLVILSPHDATSLKNLLRTLVQRATSFSETNVRLSSEPNNAVRILNYDLKILQDYCDARDIRKTIIIIPNSEAFDVQILTDFLIILQSWLNRISVCLVFGVSTSIDMFHDRMPMPAIRTLSGKSFEAAKTDEILEKMIESTLTDAHVRLRPGPALVDLVMQRFQDNLLSADAFRVAWHYAMMSHFYSNSLSIFLNEDVRYKDLNKTIFGAVRNLPSFRSFVERLLDEGQVGLVEQLLNNDLALYQEVITAIEAGLNRVEWLVGSLKIIQILRKPMLNRAGIPLSVLYTKILTSSFEDSALLRELLLFAKKLAPEDLAKALPEIVDLLTIMPPAVDISPDDFRDLQDELEELRLLRKDSLNADETQLNSKIGQYHHRSKNKKEDIHEEELSRATQKSPAYAELLSRFQGLLETYFRKTSINLEKLFLSEILFYNLKSPYRDVFSPKPKYAIERALIVPHDYLGCSCCARNQALSSTQPSTAILYQLYLESGALINAYDLWLAFSTIVDEDEQKDSKFTMALFYRGLAELKWLGMVKMSRKKVDHLAKLSWKAL